MRRLARAVLCGLAVAVVVVQTAGSATPAGLYRAMRVAGEQQRSVHYTSVEECGCASAAQITQAADVAADQGIQRITVTAAGQTGHVTVLVVGGSAYVLGDAFALTNYMGYKPDAAATYAGQWILIPPTDGDFQAVAADVTLPSSIDDVYIPAPVVSGAVRTMNGKKVVRLSGTRAASANSPSLAVSVYVRAKGLPLPVREDVVYGHSRSTTTFSRWNERVRIATPPNATPIGTTGLE